MTTTLFNDVSNPGHFIKMQMSTHFSVSTKNSQTLFSTASSNCS